MRSTKEWQEIKRNRQFTPAERRELFGDCNLDAKGKTDAYEAELVRRYRNNLPLSKEDRKTARRLVKAGGAS